MISPPLWNPASIPASAHARPTSSTASYVACCVRRAASSPWSRASRLIEMLRSGAHQAPFRPDAPNPAISRSTITIRSEGSRRAR